MRLAADIERLTKGIRALRIVRQCIREGVDVGKLSAVADRIRTTKANLDIEADKLAARLDDIDQAAPKAFDRGHAFLTAQAAEVDEIESTLRELSNLDPNAPATSARDSPKDSPPDPNAARRAAAGLAPLTAPAPENAHTLPLPNVFRTALETAPAATPIGLDAQRAFPGAAVSRAFGE